MRALFWLVFGALIAACSDDPYEGGGRRTSLPGSSRDAGNDDPTGEGGASGDDGAPSGTGGTPSTGGGGTFSAGNGAFAGRY